MAGTQVHHIPKREPMSGDEILWVDTDMQFPALFHMAEPVCRLLLPVPPSTNNLFRNGSHGGRYKTKAYKAWIAEAGWEIMHQRPPTLHPPLRTCLRVLIEAPIGPNRDIDNVLKPLLDVLTTMGVYADDKLIDRLEIVRCNNCDKCTVSLWPM
jgi:Holliday junction resolvase RusA-like endonuclease